jgi:hypothetical protein
MNYLELIDETMHNWFCSLKFEELENIFNASLIGLDVDNTEVKLCELRDDFYALDREDVLEIITDYYRK